MNPALAAMLADLAALRSGECVACQQARHQRWVALTAIGGLAVVLAIGLVVLYLATLTFPPVGQG
jgi:hypothetical protein